MDLKKPEDKKRRGQNAARAYAEIRRQILDLELPPGSDLDEKLLAARFDVSRTPLREALARLSTEQLVVMTSNRGAIVAPLTLTDFPAFLESLAFTQRKIYELAAVNATAEDLANIKAAETAFSEGRVQGGSDLAELNRNFHVAISVAAKNFHLEKFYTRLLDESVRLAGVCFSYEIEGQEFHLKQVIDEHHETTSAIAAGNIEEAGQLGLEHSNLFQKRIFEFLSRNFAEDF